MSVGRFVVTWGIIFAGCTVLQLALHAIPFFREDDFARGLTLGMIEGAAIMLLCLSPWRNRSDGRG